MLSLFQSQRKMGRAVPTAAINSTQPRRYLQAGGAHVVHAMHQSSMNRLRRTALLFSSASTAMSEMGHFRPIPGGRTISALPPIADI